MDGEATEPMIKELEEEREEFQDPEVEFAIAGAVREYGGLEIILNMIQVDKLFFPESPGHLMKFLSLFSFSQIIVPLYLVCVLFFVPIIPPCFWCTNHPLDGSLSCFEVGTYIGNANKEGLS